MTRGSNNPWLHRFAVLTAVATLFLICVGGLVTSKGVGMAVPDWPTTYGYNMFFFPFSKWVGGVFALYIVLLLTAAGVFVGHESPRKLTQQQATTVAIDGKTRSISEAAAPLRQAAGY